MCVFVVKFVPLFLIRQPLPDSCVFVRGKTKQTSTQNEEAHRQVDKDPGVAQELHQVVHEQVAFLQPKISFRQKEVKTVNKS